jgi:hypothetical protein
LWAGAIEEKEVAMTRLQVVAAFLTVGAVLSIAHLAQAQGQATDFGNRPTLSPWFGLYQKNGGPIDNYHTFVRPRIDLNDTLQRQQAGIQRNQAGINSLGQDMTQLQEEHAGIRPTGSASVFMNYSHYYPTAQGGHAAQGPAAHRRSSTRPPASSGGAKPSMPSGRGT